MRSARIFTAMALAVAAMLPAGRASADALPGKGAHGQFAQVEAGGTLLVDQLSSPTPNLIASQDFEPSRDAYDSLAADDFFVPAGQRWTISSVQVDGEYQGGGGCSSTAGPAQAVNVLFYSSTGTVPASEVGGSRNVVPAGGLASPDFSVSFPGVTLSPGHYWVAVQAVQSCTSNGRWSWRERGVQTHQRFAWMNPGNGFASGCTTWRPSQECDAVSPDLMFRLFGSASPLATCRGIAASVVGTESSEVVTGTTGVDIIAGLGGNDRIRGLDERDLICGGSGNDRVLGGRGNDEVRGDAGDDLLKGQAGRDHHIGGRGDDECRSGPGRDTGRCEFERQ